MNNYCCACGAYLKAPPQPFTIFKLPTSLSLCTILFIHCQSHHHLHSALLLAPHRPNFKFAPQVKQGCFNSGRTKSLHGRSDTNDRRRNHNSSFFIIHFSSFILTHHRQPHHRRHSSLSLAPHRPNFKFAPQVKQGCFNSGRTKSLHGRSDTNDRRRNHNSSLFIFHHSSFIIFAANPTITATLHYPSPRTIKNRNSRHRRNHNSSFFIIHFSSFILTHRRQPRTTPRPAPPQFFIFHLSFIKAPPSPLSPSFLSAPFSHFLTASYCCRAHCSPTAYSLSFSCRPLSSPRFS